MTSCSCHSRGHSEYECALNRNSILVVPIKFNGELVGHLYPDEAELLELLRYKKRGVDSLTVPELSLWTHSRCYDLNLVRLQELRRHLYSIPVVTGFECVCIDLHLIEMMGNTPLPHSCSTTVE